MISLQKAVDFIGPEFILGIIFMIFRKIIPDCSVELFCAGNAHCCYIFRKSMLSWISFFVQLAIYFADFYCAHSFKWQQIMLVFSFVVFFVNKNLYYVLLGECGKLALALGHHVLAEKYPIFKVRQQQRADKEDASKLNRINKIFLENEVWIKGLKRIGHKFGVGKYKNLI